VLTLEYEGYPVRLFEDVDGDGRVWFVSKDVAMASGYQSASELVRVVDTRNLRPYTVLTNRGTRTSSLVRGEDLLDSLSRSRLPKAEAFRKWLLDEVLTVGLRHDIHTINQEGETP
jgi:prophage antirepressor-like protein